MKRARWETWAVLVSVGLAVGLALLATLAVDWWQRGREPEMLTAKNAGVVAWVEKGEPRDLGQVRALAAEAWRPFAELTPDEKSGPGIWFRMVLPPVSAGGLSVVSPTSLEFWDVDAYWQRDGHWRRQTSGKDVAWVDRPLLSQEIAFVIDRPLNEPTEVYARFLAEDVVGGEFRYWPEASAGRQYLEITTYLYVGYFATWLAIVGYNFLLAVVLRRRAILFYVLYVTAFGVMLFYGNGLDGVVTGWESTPNRFGAILVVIQLQSFALVWFARELLGVVRGGWAKRIFNGLLAALGTSTAMIGLWYVGWMSGATMWMAVMVVLLVVAVTLPALAAARWWRGQLIAGWFLLAFVPVLAGFGVTWVLSFYEGLPDHYSLVPLLVGSGAEFVLLSVVLAFHYREIELENSRIKSEQAEKLEREVAARTQELRGLTEQLGASNRFKDRIFSVLGHDLRAPLATTISFAELIELEPEGMSGVELAEQAGALRRTNEQMLQMVDDLLSWARAEAGEWRVEKTLVPVAHVVSAPVEMLGAVARRKGLDLVVAVPADLQVAVDEKSMQTVVRNLVSNSLKFTPAGGRVEVRAFAEKEWVILSVADTGRGMDAAQAERLLGGKSGVSTTGTAHEKGTGFGWVLCVQFVRLNDGELKIRSELNQGTAVEIWLPAVSVAGAARASTASMTVSS